MSVLGVEVEDTLLLAKLLDVGIATRRKQCRGGTHSEALKASAGGPAKARVVIGGTSTPVAELYHLILD
jgi:hypothetical protein